jgi:hypothetical protein
VAKIPVARLWRTFRDVKIAASLIQGQIDALANRTLQRLSLIRGSAIHSPLYSLTSQPQLTFPPASLNSCSCLAV